MRIPSSLEKEQDRIHGRERKSNGDYSKQRDLMEEALFCLVKVRTCGRPTTKSPLESERKDRSYLNFSLLLQSRL